MGMLVDDPGQGRAARAYFFVHCDFSMRLGGISASDELDLPAHLRPQRKVARTIEPAYLREYQSMIRHWDGRGWSSAPVMNRRNREQIAVETKLPGRGAGPELLYELGSF